MMMKVYGINDDDDDDVAGIKMCVRSLITNRAKVRSKESSNIGRIYGI